MKYGRHIGAFILFLFTIFTASAQDEGKEDTVPYKELKKHIPAECKGLHRVKDVDDLFNYSEFLKAVKEKFGVEIPLK